MKNVNKFHSPGDKLAAHLRYCKERIGCEYRSSCAIGCDDSPDASLGVAVAGKEASK